MFTKIAERNNFGLPGEDDKTSIKYYAYDDNLETIDIVNMVDETSYPIKDIRIEVNDEYSYGSGEYSKEKFYEYYDRFSNYIDKATIELNGLDGRIVVYDNDKKLMLVFENVDEMPPLEITDFIKEKKMKF